MAQKPDVSIPAGPPPTELVIEDLTEGSGPEAAAGQQVDVHYVGVSWSTGKQFDASWDRRATFDFKLGGRSLVRRNLYLRLRGVGHLTPCHSWGSRQGRPGPPGEEGGAGRG